MAELRRKDRPTQSVVLEPDHLIGRGSQCSLRVNHGYVSAQHAVIRWTGKIWEILDRGGRNGTYLNGSILQAKRAYCLGLGDRIAFGHIEEEWQLTNADAPEIMVVDLETGESPLGSDGMICIPSAEEPRFVVFRDRDGSWKLEQPDREVVALHQGAVFVVAGRSYRFCCPEAVATTASAVENTPAPPVALFSVSSDEEFVEFSLEFPTHHVALGSRSHNYMLLTLARARLNDRAAGVAESSCGWLYKEALADGLAMTPQQIDGEVFRIRKHLAQSGLQQAADIIERRPRTKQIRFGIASIRVAKS